MPIPYCDSVPALACRNGAATSGTSHEPGSNDLPIVSSGCAEILRIESDFVGGLFNVLIISKSFVAKVAEGMRFSLQGYKTCRQSIGEKVLIHEFVGEK